MDVNAKVFVAGHGGLVGSALVRALRARGFARVVTRTRAELDLTSLGATDAFFAAERPDYVFFAAAKVGGILANDTYPVQFLEDNLQMEISIIKSCHVHGVKKLLFLGSSCIYPKLAPQPMVESCLLTSALEPTNQWYAIAKIAGLMMVQAYRRQYGLNGICLMPTNLYGPGDNYDLQNSHVLPALLRKAHEAKQRGDAEFVVWGSGKVMREFLHVDDLADACLFLMDTYNDEGIVNVGTGTDVTIHELATMICKTVGFQGKLVFDATKPDGTPRKLLDVSKLRNLGWTAKTTLEKGLELTYAAYLTEIAGKK